MSQRDEIARRLREARKAAGFTQAQLAAASDVDSSTISRLETAKIDSERETFDKLAAALDREAAWLMALGTVETEEELLSTENRLAVDDYLDSDIGSDTPAWLRPHLYRANWYGLAHGDSPIERQKKVHRVREALALNLAGQSDGRPEMQKLPRKNLGK